MDKGRSEPRSAQRLLAAGLAALIAIGGGAAAVAAIAADAPTVRGDIYSPECNESYLQTVITKGPKKKTGSSKATFEFKAVSCSDDSVKFKDANFFCSLDGSKFKSCESPKRYTGVKKGKHTFEVYAERFGAVDPSPAKHKWKVKD